MSFFRNMLSGASMGAMGGPMGMLVGAGLGAGVGMLQGQQQRAMDREYNNAQADMTRVGNWTGVNGQIKQVTNPLNTMLQGAGSGAAYAQQLGGMKGASEASDAATGGGFGLGGKAMAQDLGQFTSGSGMQAAQKALENNGSIYNNLQMPNMMTANNSMMPRSYGLGMKY